MALEPIAQVHPIAPVFDARSRVLILGSFPSVKSRQAMFFYAHPQNRFWRVLAALTCRPLPLDDAHRRALILEHRFALWDCIERCTISGSSDSSIRSARPNDLRRITEHAPIERIFCNGSAAYRCYQRFHEPLLGRAAVPLPSTSAANAAWSFERLCEAWQAVLA